MKKRLPKLHIFLALIITFGMLTACNLDYFKDAKLGDFTWNPSLAVPIGEISYSIEKLFEEFSSAGTSTSTNSENIVTLSYNQKLQSQTASAFLPVLNQKFSGGLQSGVNIRNIGISREIKLKKTFEYSLARRKQEKFDSIFFSGGNLNFELSSTFDAELDFSMTVRSLRRKTSRKPLEITGTLSPANTRFNANYILSAFDGIFTKDKNGGTTTNTVLVDLEYTIKVTPTTVVRSTDRINFNIALENAKFKTVFGNVGTSGLDVKRQEIALDFFKDFNATGIRFAEPVFSFIFDNSFGFPLGVDFTEISSIGSKNEVVRIQGAAVNSPFIIAAPTKDEIGKVKKSTLEMKADNSNIADMLAIQPNKVIMGVKVASNPASGPKHYNFVDTNSLLDVSVKVDIPLIMNVKNLKVKQLIDFNYGKDLKRANRLLLRVVAENQLPLGGYITLEFLNAQDKVIHTVSERPVFEGAAVGKDGRTTELKTTTADMEFTNKEIRIIEQSTRVRVVARLATKDAESGKSVKFFSDYELKLKLAVQADVTIKINGN